MGNKMENINKIKIENIKRVTTESIEILESYQKLEGNPYGHTKIAQVLGHLDYISDTIKTIEREVI
jgi:hypothetical protein